MGQYLDFPSYNETQFYFFIFLSKHSAQTVYYPHICFSHFSPVLFRTVQPSVVQWTEQQVVNCVRSWARLYGRSRQCGRPVGARFLMRLGPNLLIDSLI